MFSWTVIGRSSECLFKKINDIFVCPILDTLERKKLLSLLRRRFHSKSYEFVSLITKKPFPIGATNSNIQWGNSTLAAPVVHPGGPPVAYIPPVLSDRDLAMPARRCPQVPAGQWPLRCTPLADSSSTGWRQCHVTKRPLVGSGRVKESQGKKKKQNVWSVVCSSIPRS